MQAAGDDELAKVAMNDFLRTRELPCQQDRKQTTYRHMAVPTQVASSFKCEKLAVCSGLETDGGAGFRDVHSPCNKEKKSGWSVF
jgi:hypothetical protein